MSRERKTLAGPEKLAILRRYLVEKVPIAEPARDALIDTRSVRLITILGNDEKRSQGRHGTVGRPNAHFRLVEPCWPNACDQLDLPILAVFVQLA